MEEPLSTRGPSLKVYATSFAYVNVPYFIFVLLGKDRSDLVLGCAINIIGKTYSECNKRNFNDNFDLTVKFSVKIVVRAEFKNKAVVLAELILAQSTVHEPPS
jgi:hypothetical protein